MSKKVNWKTSLCESGFIYSKKFDQNPYNCDVLQNTPIRGWLSRTV